MRAGTGLTVYTRAGNRTIGGKRTRHEGSEEITGAESDEFSVWANGVGITSGILLRGNDAVEKSNDGDESVRSCILMIVKDQKEQVLTLR